LIEGADHGLSTEAWHSAYTTLLVNWFTEIVFGKPASEPAAEAPALVGIAAEAPPASASPQPEA
jgi:hypothetical protein